MEEVFVEVSSWSDLSCCSWWIVGNELSKKMIPGEVMPGDALLMFD
jgi:hypothetical protein